MSNDITVEEVTSSVKSLFGKRLLVAAALIAVAGTAVALVVRAKNRKVEETLDDEVPVATPAVEAAKRASKTDGK